jgi:hypothetical protein
MNSRLPESTESFRETVFQTIKLPIPMNVGKRSIIESQDNTASFDLFEE